MWSLRERSCSLPLSRFSPCRALWHAAVLFAALAVIHFLRTSCNTDISRSHTSCFHDQVFLLFLKNFFFFSSLYGVMGDGAQQVLGCIAAWMSSDFCVEQKIRVWQLCVFISPLLKIIQEWFHGGVVFPRINVLF